MSQNLVYLYPEEQQEEEQGARPVEPASRLVSVTRVLQATMSEESRAALRRWELAMVKKHGEDGFAEIKQAMLETGREWHAALHAHLTGEGEVRQLTPTADGFWRSVRPVLALVDSARVAASERDVTHSPLGYHGVVDCVAPFR
ncbi:mitochondrial genome maintenance exonuclease 1-like [Pollicipes pollicipes]|uniref:mitochondrial genome maintenance exonuclease 1-like n=1 Tax=Pollicipes pollicipes TaxID=41117 RepID=UPI001885A060|nr:mitochondrial genome maintenance exonuclease 1-like [Pollicipes pollicipes]